MISIITVTFNAEKTIEKTLKSLLEQDYSEYELIIKDANSNDKTIKIIKEYISKFVNKGVIIKYLSCIDLGIYDGMNQALNKVSNDWVYFLNAGDTLYNKSTLQSIVNNIENKFDIIYGAVNVVLNNKTSKIKNPLKLKKINKEMIFSHQGVIIKTNLLKSRKYSLNYKSCSDYDFFLNMYKLNKKFKEINVIFSNYDLNGYSNQNSLMTIKESEKISLKFNKNKISIVIFFKYLICREIIKIFIKKKIGINIFNKIREIKLKGLVFFK